MLLFMLAQMQAPVQCVPHIDTVRDTIYAVLTPAHTTDQVTASALTPVIRAIAAQANSQGAQVLSLGAGPSGPILDLRIGAQKSGLPPMLDKLPTPEQFTLHRDGTITLASNRLYGTSASYPDGMTADSLVLRLSYTTHRDSTHASAPFYLRRIYILPIKQQPVAAAANPRPVGKIQDTALVQFAVTADGIVDTSTFYPIRARSQTSIDAVRAILPALRFTPALALNDCPARTVLSQRFIITPE